MEVKGCNALHGVGGKHMNREMSQSEVIIAYGIANGDAFAHSTKKRLYAKICE